MEPFTFSGGTGVNGLSWEKLSRQCQAALLDNVMPFWQKHSMDTGCGGYLHHIDRDGGIYCTDKMMWMEGREVYMLARLYNEVERRKEWLDAAKLGADFIGKYGQDQHGNYYLLLDRQGHPLRVASNIYSDFFAVMGLLEYAQASGESWPLESAVKTFWNIVARRDNPKGAYNKVLPRPDLPSDHTFCMILLHVAGMMQNWVDDERLEDLVRECLSTIMTRHVDEDARAVFEYVWPDNSRPDTPAGRLLNPGHAVESMWFVMEAASKRGMRDLVAKASDAMLWSLERGWDREFGGLYYFLDIHGRPVESLEWNMKLWWPHCEALIGLLLAYEESGRSEFAEWYERVHDYTWKTFPDPRYGEWLAYCDRRGTPTHDLKGGKWKGCFHVPRMLLKCWRIAERLDSLSLTATFLA